MSKMADLVYRISADGSQFDKELKKASKGVDGFGARAGAALKKLGTAFAAAGAAAATALAAMVRSAINSNDELAKMSQRIGVAVEDLSALRYAAELSGVEMGTLEKGLGKLSLNMLDAAGGTGRAAAAFGKLGIAADDGNGNLRDTADVLADVADRFSQMDDGAEKSALAVDLFGKAGKDLIPLLNAGRDGLDEMRAEAEALGLVIDSDTAAASERFNDNLTRLQGALKGVVNRVTAAVLPALEALTNQIVAAAKDGATLAKVAAFITTGFRIVVTTIKVVVGVFRILGEVIGGVLALGFNSFKGLVEVIKAFGNVGITTFNSIGKVLEAFAKNAQAVFSAFRKALSGDFSGAFEDIKAGLAGVGNAFVEATKSQAAAIFDVGSTYVDVMKSQVGILGDIAGQVTDIVVGTATDIKDIWTAEAPNIEAATKKAAQSAFRPVAEEAEAVVKDAEVAREKIERAITVRPERVKDALVEIVEETRRTLTTMEELAQGAAASVLDSFQDFMFNPFEASLKDMLASFIQTLAKMAAEVAKRKILESLFTGAAAGATGGVLGFARGGYVSGPGSGTSDSIPARLSNGEYVMPADTVRVTPRTRG
jgi:hypothetical protein